MSTARKPSRPRYTDAQRFRALRKLTRAFARWNRRLGGSETSVLLEIWPTLRKFEMDEYYQQVEPGQSNTL